MKNSTSLLHTVLLSSLVPLYLLLIALCTSQEHTEPKEVKIEVLTAAPETCDRKAKRGDLLTVKYKGYLEDGKIFDNSDTHPEPFRFQMGAGMMIRGWEIGLKDACAGEQRRVIIPPEFGFGDHGNPSGIPGKATLTFDIEVLSIEDGKEIPDVFSKMDVDGDKRLTREEVRLYFMSEDRKQGVQVDPQQYEEMVEQTFKYEDRDNDNYISHQEFSGPKHEEL